MKNSRPFTYLLLIVMVINASANSQAQAPIHDLSEFQWVNRIVLVVNPQDASDTVSELEANANAFTERHTLWFILLNDTVQTSYKGPISETFFENLITQFSDTREMVYLIGKDGGIKLKSEQLDLPRIYGLIDSMPMRRREIAEQASQQSHGSATH